MKFFIFALLIILNINLYAANNQSFGSTGLADSQTVKEKELETPTQKEYRSLIDYNKKIKEKNGTHFYSYIIGVQAGPTSGANVSVNEAENDISIYDNDFGLDNGFCFNTYFDILFSKSASLGAYVLFIGNDLSNGNGEASFGTFALSLKFLINPIDNFQIRPGIFIGYQFLEVEVRNENSTTKKSYSGDGIGLGAVCDFSLKLSDNVAIVCTAGVLLSASGSETTDYSYDIEYDEYSSYNDYSSETSVSLNSAITYFSFGMEFGI